MNGSKAEFELGKDTFIAVEFPNPKEQKINDEMGYSLGLGWRF